MRTRRKRNLTILLVAASSTLTLTLLDKAYFDPLRKAETYSRDLRQCWGRKATLDPRLVFLALDKGSVQLDSLFPDEIEASPALKMMKAGYPWSREVYSLISERLIQAGAQVVIFDLLFPTQGTGDPAFRATLDKYPDRILVGCDFVAERTGAGAAWRLDLPTETLLERKRPLDPRLGYVTFWSDPDGAVRQLRMTTSLEELSNNQNASDEVFQSLEARTLYRLNRPDLIRRGETLPFRFVGGPHTIQPHPIYQIFVPDFWKRNFQDGKFFSDKIVFVGPEGSWSHDEHATPFRVIDGDEALMPGPEIHLNALNAALHGDFLIELPPKKERVIFIVAGLCGMLLSVPRGPVWRSIVTAGALLLFANIAVVAYNEVGLFLPMVVPYGIVLTTVLGNIIVDYRSERREKNEIRSALTHYVGKNVLDEILLNPAPYLHSLSGVRKTVTVMFSDLRDFTALTASRPPAELVAQLNEYFSAMTDAVLAENGTVDKLMGDGMMAIWGNLRSDGPREDAHAALRCALAMRAALNECNIKWQAQGWPSLRFGIGLAHGDATVGNIGSERKMDFTAIGGVINKASRIEQLTRETGRDILLGPSLAVITAGAFEMESVCLAKVKGIVESLEIFALVGKKDPHNKRMLASPAANVKSVAGEPPAAAPPKYSPPSQLVTTTALGTDRLVTAGGGEANRE